MVTHTVNHHHIGPQGAKIAIDIGETKRPLLPQLPSPSLDHGFKSDRSLLSVASSMSSRSDRLDGSWHSQ